MKSRLSLAHILAILVPGGLLGGALAFQYLGGLAPCELCVWQRWPHGVALGLALLALLPMLAGARRALIALAAAGVAISGMIGVYHAGIEQHWWQGVTACTAPPVAGTTEEILAQIMATPLVRCDAIPWSLMGISMAGWNAILSLSFAGVMLWLIRKKA